MDAKLAIAKKRIIFITYQGDIPIGGVYIIFDNKRSYYILGGYDTNKSHYGASAYALWEAIKYTKNQLLLNEFDFEGSMAQQIEHFFRQFGGILTPYYSIKKLYSWFELIRQIKNWLRLNGKTTTKE